MRLIDADALIKTIRENDYLVVDYFNSKDRGMFTSGIMQAIDEQPTIEPDLQEYSVWFRIGETLVDVSKMHITAEEGIEKIRSYLMRMKKPERKNGKWIEHNPHKWGLGIKYECSECGYEVDCEEPNFCPNCGADMRGENK